MSQQSPQGGALFVISAPSGAGKTSLVKALIESTAGVQVSISHTTRKPRPGEVNGQDYHFVDNQYFDQLVAQGDFLEHARVFDNQYGTSRQAVEQQLQQGVDVILEIDWQGARRVIEQIPDCTSIFILPPSLQALRERLTGRGQDDSETIERRMRDARSESSHYDEYQYVVINDDFETALNELSAVILTQRLTMARQSLRYREMLHELLA